MIKRSEIRDLVATLFRSTVSAEKILDHLDPEVSGNVSVVQITSAGSQRRSFSRSYADTTVMIGVVVFVLQYSPDDWTLEQGEDLIDLIESQMAEVLSINQNTNLWRSIQWDQPSMVDRVVLSGTPYLMESMLLNVEVK